MKYTLLLLVFVLFCSHGSSAQSDELIKKVEDLHKAAKAKLTKVSHKKMIIAEYRSLKDGTVSLTSEEDITFLIPKRTRIIRRNTRPNETFVSENIFINSVRYFRENGGEWKKEDYRGDNFTALGYGREFKKSVSFEGQEELNGKKASKYRITRTLQGSNPLEQNTEELWFDEKGLLLKSVTEGVIGNGDFRKKVTTYDYDVRGIKIVAPIK